MAGCPVAHAKHAPPPWPQKETRIEGGNAIERRKLKIRVFRDVAKNISWKKSEVLLNLLKQRNGLTRSPRDHAVQQIMVRLQVLDIVALRTSIRAVIY